MPNKPETPREIARKATRRIRALTQTLESSAWVDAHWVQIVSAIEDAIQGKHSNA